MGACVRACVVVVAAFWGVVDCSALCWVFSFIVCLFVWGLAKSLRMVIRARQMNEREEAKKELFCFSLFSSDCSYFCVLLL